MRSVSPFGSGTVYRVQAAVVSHALPGLDSVPPAAAVVLATGQLLVSTKFFLSPGGGSWRTSQLQRTCTRASLFLGRSSVAFAGHSAPRIIEVEEETGARV